MSTRSAAKEILVNTGVTVHPDEFAVLSVSRESFQKLLADSSLSPGGASPFMIFSDPFEVTLVLNADDFENIKRGSADLRYDRGYRLVTFNEPMDLSVVGFMAEVSAILADAGISILALSSFSRDHLLIRQTDLANALKALGPYVKELC